MMNKYIIFHDALFDGIFLYDETAENCHKIPSVYTGCIHYIKNKIPCKKCAQMLMDTYQYEDEPEDRILMSFSDYVENDEKGLRIYLLKAYKTLYEKCNRITEKDHFDFGRFTSAKADYEMTYGPFAVSYCEKGYLDKPVFIKGSVAYDAGTRMNNLVEKVAMLNATKGMELCIGKIPKELIPTVYDGI